MAKAKKPKKSYVCTECGYTSPKWMGKCPSCGAWNSLEESAPPSQGRRATSENVRRVEPTLLHKVDLSAGEVRLRTGIGELDRVLGGGLVTGGITLIGGDPGVGNRRGGCRY